MRCTRTPCRSKGNFENRATHLDSPRLPAANPCFNPPSLILPSLQEEKSLRGEASVTS